MKNKKAPFLFILPGVVLIVTFATLPILVAFVLGFTDMDLSGLVDFKLINFIGLKNYKEILLDEAFWTALKNTLYYVVVGVPAVVVLATLIAIAINFIAGKSEVWFRGIYYMPAITNIVAVSVVWMFIYNREFGILNYILGLFNIESIGWLSDPKFAKFSLVVLSVWRAIGLNMIIMLAAIKGIPSYLYEAANIDGLSMIQKFFKITVPQLKFAIFFVTVTTLIGWFRFFEEPFVMTNGGPLDSTLSISLYVYQQGFSLSEFGYASSISILLFIIIIVITAIQLRVRKKQEV